MTNKMHSITWSADGALTIDGAQDCVEVQPAKHDSELEILNAVVNRMSTILANISITLNGTEPALQRHSYHDLAEKVAVLQLEVDMYRHHATLTVQPADYEFNLRGFLAARLLCWHRLTEAEAQNIVRVFEAAGCGSK